MKIDLTMSPRPWTISSILFRSPKRKFSRCFDPGSKRQIKYNQILDRELNDRAGKKYRKMFVSSENEKTNSTKI